MARDEYLDHADQDREPDEPTDDPEDEEPDEDDIDELELGRYEPFDYTDQPFVTLSEKARNHLYQMFRSAAKRDMAARRMEVEQEWEAQLFDRGYQYLFPRRGGGWQLFSAASGKTWSQMQGAQVYETNVYGAHKEILASALTRDIPNGRFEPQDPDCDADVTAAESAEEYKELFAKNNDLKQLHSEISNYMCTGGRVLIFTTYRLDGQRFGFEDERDPAPVVPETDHDTEGASERTRAPRRGRARGREILEVFSKLSHKVPIQARDLSDMDFVLAYWEMDEGKAKAKYPWIEKKIHPGVGGIGEIGIDRIARINVCLALEGGYVTGDTFNQQVTMSYGWFRPAAFYQIKDLEIRQEFFDNFPDGCFAAYASDELAFCRNESMEDHLHILQAMPGAGQNRRGLLTSILSIQKRLNNWIDLLNDFFVRTVPTMWMDSEVFNIEALAKQNNVPGQRRPFLSVPGRQIQEMIYAEPLPQHQPELPAFIQLFFKDFPEMLSGALPSLFGAESNTDTVGGISIQRDQALGRLGTPWSRLQAAAACYLQQAVQLAARCRLARGDTRISWVGEESKKMTLEITDLKGHVLCYPEADANFPETWGQRSARVQMLIQEAPQSPLVTQLLADPENLRMLKDAIGLKEFVISEADSVDKQRGEFEVLLKSMPQVLPNPQYQQMEQQIQIGEQQALQQGPEGYAQFMQTLPQAQQMLAQVPQQISSCPVAQDASENHQIEATTCFKMMNSPIGRKLRTGTPEQQQAYQNLKLHWQEHTQMAQKLNPPAPAGKPPSVSVAATVDKMPNDVASQLLQNYYGIQASPQSFGEQDAAETEQDITKRIASRPVEAPRPAPSNGSQPQPAGGQ